jgi:hypothetical protein
VLLDGDSDMAEMCGGTRSDRCGAFEDDCSVADLPDVNDFLDLRQQVIVEWGPAFEVKDDVIQERVLDVFSPWEPSL